MVFSGKQLKVFKRLYTDFRREYNTLTGSAIRSELFNQETLKRFFDEVYLNLDEFTICNNAVLSKVRMLHHFDATRVKIQWLTLHNLFLILYPNESILNLVSKNEIVIQLEKGRKAHAQLQLQQLQQLQLQQQQLQQEPASNGSDGSNGGGLFDSGMINQMLPMVMNMFNNPKIMSLGESLSSSGELSTANITEITEEMLGSFTGLDGVNKAELSKGISDITQNSNMMDLLKDTSDKLLKSVEGKNINPMEMIAGLMAGNTKIGGIDISEIALDASSKLKMNENVGAGVVPMSTGTTVPIKSGTTVPIKSETDTVAIDKSWCPTRPASID